MTPTPTQIATEADWHQLAAAHFGYIPGAELAKTDKEVATLAAYLKEQVPALILSAAAKMVQQSGAVEALREDIISARIIHSEAEHNGKWAIQRDCAFIEERCYKALDRLRSITGEAGK